MDLNEIVNFMLELATDAKHIVDTHQTYKKMDKGVLDVVTDVDVLIEKHCINKIKQKYPNIDIVSEELNSKNQPKSNYFSIDPIDGTKNFVAKIPLFGFQMAYVENGECVASLIDLPSINMQIKSIKGVGAFCNGQKVVLNKNQDTKHSFWVVEGSGKKWDVAKQLENEVLAVRCFGCTSATGAFLAKGEICVIVCDWKTPWDILPTLGFCQHCGMSIATFKDSYVLAPTKQLADFGIKIVQKAYKN